MAKRDPSTPLKGRAEPYSFARACGYGIWEATRRAGSNPETGQGSKWEARADVQARIAWWRAYKQTDEILAEKRALIERELQLVGLANMDDFVALIPDNAGRFIPVLDLTKINAMALPERRAAMAAVKTVKYTENGPAFELHDKGGALAQLRDMHGLKGVTKIAPTNPAGDQPYESVSDAERVRAIMALAARAGSEKATA
jgi:hypothetical protein